MKIKKRYYVACMLMCVAALLLGIATFYVEMGLSRYAKLNSVTSKTWMATSGSDLETRLNTDLFVSKVYDITDEDHFDYIGTQVVVDGKYMAYDQEVYATGIVLNGDAELGQRYSIYYKPDDPHMIYRTTSYGQYLVILAAIIVITAVLIVVCRILNKSLKDNTFSESAVTIMDIPIVALVAAVILAFFAGMLIGNVQVDSTYTVISEGLAQQYASHDLTI